MYQAIPYSATAAAAVAAPRRGGGRSSSGAGCERGAAERGGGGGVQGLGVNPAVHEVAGEADLAGLLGGLDRLMAVHISGDLVPILKDAGALLL